MLTHFAFHAHIHSHFDSSLFSFSSSTDGKFYPAGSRLFLMLQRMHKNEKYFKNAEAFVPERHDSLKSSSEANNFAYVPFSAGYRNCIGQKFAQFEIKTVISKLLLNYELQLEEGFKADATWAITTYSENGIWLKLKKRGI